MTKRVFRALGPIFVAGLLSCSAPSDGALELAAFRADTLDAAMRACSQVVDPGHRGFCIADAVRVQGKEAPEAALAACSTVESTAWRAECYFFTADHLAADGEFEGALMRCDDASPFQANCVMHVFAELSRSVQKDQPLADAAESFNAALSLLEVSTLRRDDALHRRLWNQFFQEVLSPDAQVSVEHCTDLRGATKSKCVNGARLRLTQQVHAALRTPGAIQEACEVLVQEGARAAATRLKVGYADEPSLDQAVEGTLQRACRHRPADSKDRGSPLDPPP